MKKYLFGFILISSFSTYAREYYTVSRDLKCNLTADFQSISLEKTELPNKIEFTIDISERRFDKKRILGNRTKAVVASRLVNISDNAPLQVSKAMIDNSHEIKIEFDRLSRSEFNELLTILGNEEGRPKPAKGVKNLKMSISDLFFSTHDKELLQKNPTWLLTSKSVGRLREQVHYRTWAKDGSSYHLNITCAKPWVYDLLTVNDLLTGTSH